LVDVTVRGLAHELAVDYLDPRSFAEEVAHMEAREAPTRLKKLTVRLKNRLRRML